MTRKLSALFLLLVATLAQQVTVPELDSQVLDYLHVLQQQDEESEWPTNIDKRFTHYDAFLQGFRSNEVLPSAMNCSRYLRSSLLTYNETKLQWKNESAPDYGNHREKIFDTTEWVSYDLAPSSRYCFMANVEVYLFWRLKKAQFGGGFGEILPAWLQNLLGNVITLNAIQTKIEDAKLANDTVATAYWYGRLANIMLVFEPIVVDEFEDKEMPDFNLLWAQVEGFMTRVGQTFDNPDGDIEEEFNPNSIDRPGNLFTNTFYFTRGYFSTAFGDTSPNSTVCEGNITKSINDTKSLRTNLKQFGNTTVLNQTALDFEGLLSTVHPITYSCYYTGYEYKETYDGYISNIKESDAMAYNAIHKLGNLYDAVFYLRKHMKTDKDTIETKREMADYWFKMGAYAGLIFNIVLYTVEGDTGPVDPLAEPVDEATEEVVAGLRAFRQLF